MKTIFVALLILCAASVCIAQVPPSSPDDATHVAYTVGQTVITTPGYPPSGWTCTGAGSTVVQGTGNTTAGSSVVTQATNWNSWMPGQAIYGVGIPMGTTVTSSATGVVNISQLATATNTGVNLSGVQWTSTTSSISTGPTSARPVFPSGTTVGFVYLDTTLAANGLPITWTGSVWVDSTGAVK